jgi:hypothetical protein
MALLLTGCQEYAKTVKRDITEIITERTDQSYLETGLITINPRKRNGVLTGHPEKTNKGVMILHTTQAISNRN